MYRVSFHVVKNAALLIRRSSPLDFRIVSFSRSAINPDKKFKVREPCPQVEKPLPPLKLPSFYVVVTGLFLAATAGFLVYAKQNQEVRDWLSINMPWFDDLIAVMYEENYPKFKHFMDFLKDCKDYLNKLMQETPEECKKHPAIKAVPVSSPPPVVTVSDDDDDDDDDDKEEDDEKNEENKDEVCILPPPDQPVITEDICQLEECIKNAGDEVIHNIMTCRDYCIYYNKLVDQTMTSNFSLKGLKFLKTQQVEREEVILKEHLALAKASKVHFKNLSQYIDCGAKASKERLAVSKQIVRDYEDRMVRLKMEYEMVYQESLKRDQQWKIVECLLNTYIMDTTSLYPELNYSDNDPVIKADYDLFLMLQIKYLNRLEAQYAEVARQSSRQISRAYEALPLPEKEKKEKLAAASKKVKADSDKMFQDKNAQMKKNNEQKLKEEKAAQLKRYEENLSKNLAAKEEEANKNAEKMIKKKVDAEKKLNDVQLNEMALQLKIVEMKLEERLKAERESKRAQDLYTASASLLAATKKGLPHVKVNKELQMLENAATDDKLVMTVLNAIPGEVKEKGIVPEAVLKDRYKTMEDVAMKVSMVESEGAILPLYGISWLQSKLLFMKPSALPQVEVDNPLVEPFEGLDTFDLLQRARYFMDNGNLATAVRYVDALQGASRGAAESWYRAANAHLQTRQAAEAILAHASALNLKYLT